MKPDRARLERGSGLKKCNSAARLFHIPPRPPRLREALQQPQPPSRFWHAKKPRGDAEDAEERRREQPESG
jgi:hypothetical protein